MESVREAPIYTYAADAPATESVENAGKLVLTFYIQSEEHELSIQYMVYSCEGPGGYPGYMAVGLDFCIFEWASESSIALNVLMRSLAYVIEEALRSESPVEFLLRRVVSRRLDSYRAIYREFVAKSQLQNGTSEDSVRRLLRANSVLRSRNEQLELEVEKLKITYIESKDLFGFKEVPSAVIDDSMEGDSYGGFGLPYIGTAPVSSRVVGVYIVRQA